nr:beta-1,3-galactosyltransferase 5-like [Lytechinus pictus]
MDYRNFIPADGLIVSSNMSRRSLMLYSIGFLSGVLLLGSLSQFGQVVRMEEQIQISISQAPDHIRRQHATVVKGLVGDNRLVALEEEADLVVGGEKHTSTDAVPTREDKLKLNQNYAGQLNGQTDPHDYKYIHNPSRTCLKNSGKRLKVFVIFYSISAPHHFLRRQTIRKTYGDRRHWDSVSMLRGKGVVRTVFLLGATSNETLQRDIDSESAHHGDIVQEDFLDSYLNLTVKTVMGLKWVTNYCRHAQYAMKIDDDTMMNQRLFHDKVLTNAPLTDYATGKTWVRTAPVRNAKKKFYVSEEDYPFPTFPPYLNGGAYVLSSDVVLKAYRAALTTPIFKWEDVFLGMCLQKAGVGVRDIDRFLLFKFKEDESYDRRVHRVNSYVFISDLNVTEMVWVWNQGQII